LSEGNDDLLILVADEFVDGHADDQPVAEGLGPLEDPEMPDMKKIEHAARVSDDLSLLYLGPVHDDILLSYGINLRSRQNSSRQKQKQRNRGPAGERKFPFLSSMLLFSPAEIG